MNIKKFEGFGGGLGLPLGGSMCTTPSRVVKHHLIFFKTLFKNEVKYASLSGASSLFFCFIRKISGEAEK